MKAVIMAGGKGTRLRPLTCNTPKPMVPLLDRPVMEYTIELLKKHGITDIAVTIQYLPEVIRQHFGDGSEFGVRLQYYEEETPLGTAGSVKNAEKFLDEPFIVISGDAMTDFDLTRAVRFHREKGAVATLVLTHEETPLEFGVVMTDETGSIIRFLEKPSWGEVFSDTVNTGIYILEPEVFKYFDHGKAFDFSKDLFPILLKLQRPTYGYVAEGYWSDIGNLTQYRQTQFDMLDGKVDVKIKGNEIAPKVWAGANVKLGSNVALNGPSFIGDGCGLGDGSCVGEYSVIGGGSLLKHDVTLDRAILWKHNYVEQGADIKGATVCRGVTIRAGATLDEGAVVGDAVQIGTKSVVRQGIKIWPNKIVDNHATLNHSLIWGEKTGKNLFGYCGVTGTCGVDITTSFVNRLALAYGSNLLVGSAIGIGYDASPFAELIADSFASGLHASGVNTYPFHAVTSSVTRHAVSQMQECVGGVHIRMLSNPGDGCISLEFLDSGGLLIAKGDERKIENSFYQEDYRRIEPELVGRRKVSPPVSVNYREAMLETVSKEEIRRAGYKVVLEYDHRHLHHIIPELLEFLGCKVILLNRITSTAAELARWVSSNEADFGIRLDANAQQLVAVTGQGEVVKEEVLSILQFMIQLQYQEGSFLYVPVKFPNIVDSLAAETSRWVVRTKADPRSIMEGCQHRGFHIFFDGLYTLIQMMHMMAVRRTSLSQLIQSIPTFTLLKRMVDCPWSEKGKVMRFLMEETKGKRVELIDGIKVFHDGGWTLVLPDSDQPVFQVFADADTEQLAEHLATACTLEIEDYRRRGTS
jgi:mannose-1-phosphate guanylyltransferase/phosphomannomutase